MKGRVGVGEQTRDIGRVPMEVAAAALPERARVAVAWRFQLDVRRGTWIGGMLGTLGGVTAWMLGRLTLVRDDLTATSEALTRGSGYMPPDLAHATSILHSLSPAGLVLAYVTLSSALRWAHVAVTGEPLGDPLLGTLAWLGRLATGKGRTKTAAPEPQRAKRAPSKTYQPDVMPTIEQTESTGPPGTRWHVDDGEEARLTPEGPTAAVVESLGSLPLRARTEGGIGYHQPAFPGTAVVLEGERFEVVAEEMLAIGARYRLQPWPADHILRDGVVYGARLVRVAQREREEVVQIERAQRWSWLLYPLVGMLPETRQHLACHRLGLDARMATLVGAICEAIGCGAGLLVGLPTAWWIGPTILRGVAALTIGEVSGSVIVVGVVDVVSWLTPVAPRYDASTVPLTREAFWARLGLPDRQEKQDDGSILVESLLPHLGWGVVGGVQRIAAGEDWWSVARLPPVLAKGRLTHRYLLMPAADPALGEPEAPGDRVYQEGVLADVQRRWDDLLFAGSWLVSLMPEDVQRRAFGSRGGPAASRRSTYVTALLEIASAFWFLRPHVLELLTFAFLLLDGGRRVLLAWEGSYGPSLLGGLVADLLPPERKAYHRHVDAERETRAGLG